MLGTHKPQQQATVTKQIKIPEIFFRFRFRNLTAENPKSWDFFFFSLVLVSVRMVQGLGLGKEFRSFLLLGSFRPPGFLGLPGGKMT